MPSSREIDVEDKRGDRDARAAGEPRPGAEARPPAEAQPTTPAATDAPSDELARIEDRYRRALADLDNYRKRAAREVQRRTDEVREAMILDWLDVVDSVDRAIRLEPDGPCRAGLQAVMQQMDAVLVREGVTRIGATGEAFDPQRHDAISARAADGAPAHAVLDVARSGFALGERVIRPAQVVVARAPDHSD
jgi:molecular chaperone GrpE